MLFRASRTSPDAMRVAHGRREGDTKTRRTRKRVGMKRRTKRGLAGDNEDDVRRPRHADHRDHRTMTVLTRFAVRHPGAPYFAGCLRTRTRRKRLRAISLSWRVRVALARAFARVFAVVFRYPGLSTGGWGNLIRGSVTRREVDSGQRDCALGASTPSPSPASRSPTPGVQPPRKTKVNGAT